MVWSEKDTIWSKLNKETSTNLTAIHIKVFFNLRITPFSRQIHFTVDIDSRSGKSRVRPITWLLEQSKTYIVAPRAVGEIRPKIWKKYLLMNSWIIKLSYEWKIGDWKKRGTLISEECSKGLKCRKVWINLKEMIILYLVCVTYGRLNTRTIFLFSLGLARITHTWLWW